MKFATQILEPLARPGRLLLTLLFAVILTACATLTADIKIESQDNPQVDYAQYHTYAFVGSAQIVFDPVGQWEQPTLDTDEEVRFMINSELRKLGMAPSDSSPDLFVAYAAGVDMTALELKEDPETKKKVLTNVPRAALLVALIDARTGYTVWLGYATGEVQKQQNIENIRRRIDYAVSGIFRRYADSLAQDTADKTGE